MKCRHCPVAAGTCLGESAPRLCQLADPGHPDHDPRYRGELVRLAGSRPPARRAAPPARTDGRTAAQALDLVRRMKGCPFYGRGPGCGCSGALCGLKPPGKQVVSHQYCFDCLERYG